MTSDIFLRSTLSTFLRFAVFCGSFPSYSPKGQEVAAQRGGGAGRQNWTGQGMVVCSTDPGARPPQLVTGQHRHACNPGTPEIVDSRRSVGGSGWITPLERSRRRLFRGATDNGHSQEREQIETAQLDPNDSRRVVFNRQPEATPAGERRPTRSRAPSPGDRDDRED